MLSRDHRILAAEDFRVTLRRGRRIGGGLTIVSSVRTSPELPSRFGFVVTKKVGNAVNRNKVRRRMRAIARELVDGGFVGSDVVIRALPAAVGADWTELHRELTNCITKGHV